MLFNKMMTMKMFMFSFFMLSLMINSKDTIIELNFYYSLNNLFYLSFYFNQLSKTFIIMVSVVSWAVLSYSSMYMESYNKKKFFYLMMAFFTSMIILVSSNSIMTMITGWDFLGITSISLIMLYQNNNTMSNSLLTMFFNRVGDIFLFFSFSEMLKMMVESTMENKMISMNYTLMMLLLTAAATKSAQVPMSAWLPAAMSAPTPISAMVHSSTLVTAGIYLFLKLNKSTEPIYPMISFFSCSTLLIASMAANMESDMKKIIAFSTMSQISIMMIMISCLNNKMLAMTHMFNHAIFKTLLFMTAGKTFMENWSNQSNLKTKSFNNSTMTKSALTSSIIAMSGTPFSSSFFSKDKFMELNKWENKMNSISFILTMASIATILYSKKIFFSFKNHLSSSSSVKKMSIKSFIMMSYISAISGPLNCWVMKIFNKPIIMKKEMMMINLTVILTCFVPMMNNHKYIKNISNNMLFLKWLSSNIFFNLHNLSSLNNNLNMIVTESMMWKFNKSNFYFNKTKMMYKLSIMTLIMIILTFI